MDVRFCEGRNHRREARVRAAGSARVRRARSSEARVRRFSFLLTKTYMDVGKPYLTGDYGRVAPSLVATDSSSTRESCILGIVIELLRIDRGGWVALFPGNCSTYGFVDIH